MGLTRMVEEHCVYCHWKILTEHWDQLAEGHCVTSPVQDYLLTGRVSGKRHR